MFFPLGRADATSLLQEGGGVALVACVASRKHDLGVGGSDAAVGGGGGARVVLQEAVGAHG